MCADLESGIVAARDTDDWLNGMIPSLGTGTLFESGNGPRSAATAGDIGGSMAGAAVAGKQAVKRYVPI